VEQLDTMVLPEASVLSDQSGRFVMVVDDKNIVGIKRVKTGPVIDNQIAILSGLTTTDRVITTGIQKARPGSPVTPKPAGAPGATGGAAAAPAPEKK
jgi:hypothetical protein